MISTNQNTEVFSSIGDRDSDTKMFISTNLLRVKFVPQS